jgi:CRP/FNR family transcriptional regulator, cyclic AMP receptor protein
MENLADSLRRVPMLAALKEEHLEMLVKLATTRTYNQGETIIKQGDPGAGLFVILEGTVEVTMRERPGQPETKLGNLSQGEFFGEMSLIDGYPRSATVTAKAETQVVELDRWVFLDALRREPNIAVAMLPILTRRIRALEERKR